MQASHSDSSLKQHCFGTNGQPTAISSMTNSATTTGFASTKVGEILDTIEEENNSTTTSMMQSRIEQLNEGLMKGNKSETRLANQPIKY
ncbi:hypothetical protein WR25_10361 [Diploscapter pachys]|uniref:Uncharacterized protein n=1 Tax=Diploscapter pachys TaxID=2018661 RepID=A0A2A2JH33_9BILA|nr:hypothetical protein WR25_10361 [Diploscapter pachys]